MSAYLDLLEKTLLHWFWEEPLMDGTGKLNGLIVDPDEKEIGDVAWPSKSFTMLNRVKLRNIRDLISKAVEEGIPGDYAECGVWRGGSCIYARACLPEDRTVHVCDSFDGFPPDEPEEHWKLLTCLSVKQSEVMENFRKFGFETGVKFVPGYFKDTLPTLDKLLCVLRVDCDSRKSTMECLSALWPKLSIGGYVIFDDFYEQGSAQAEAVQEYFGSIPDYNRIDRGAIWFKKQ